MKQYKCNTLDDLAEISTQIIQNITHKTIAFEGEMGAGKTTLIKELAKTLGCLETVSSPTYTLVNEYKYEKGSIYHFDFYRIQNLDEAYDMGVEEYFYSQQFCFVEWAEKVASLLPVPHHILHIENKEGVRFIEFT